MNDFCAICDHQGIEINSGKDDLSIAITKDNKKFSFEIFRVKENWFYFDFSGAPSSYLGTELDLSLFEKIELLNGSNFKQHYPLDSDIISFFDNLNKFLDSTHLRMEILLSIPIQDFATGSIDSFGAVGYLNNERFIYHNLDGPAMFSDRGEEWLTDGEHHREDGPAIKYKDDYMIDEYWYHGDYIEVFNDDDFLKVVKYMNF
jgi:hypothetical protein